MGVSLYGIFHTIEMYLLETERLYLRELQETDADNIYLLNSDPDVIRYTGDNPFENIEETRNFLINYDHYKKFRLGRWAVLRKSDDQFLGWCGLRYISEDDEYDLGFRFLKTFWNQGYATESARACIRYGFAVRSIHRIIGRALKENTASIKVLKKTGMQFFHESNFHGMPAVTYKIDKKDYPF